MHLIDSFIELFAYTRYFLGGLGQAQPTYEEVVQHYAQLLDRAEKYATAGDYSERDCHLALFAVCAWIDEMILCSAWESRGAWQSSQLQRTYFQTTNAGEEFFQLLEGLDPGEREVREVYEYCLALGFKGRYFHPGDAPALEEVKRANLARLLDNPDAMFPKDLFPDASRTTAAGRKRRRLRFSHLVYLLLFLAPLALFVGLYLTYRQLLDRIVLNYFGPGF
jgi:type VI secretion system protein ImpK